MIEGLAGVLDLTEAGLAVVVLVFVRVGAVAALLPGFGEQMIPARVRLAAAIALTMVVAPMVAPEAAAVDPARPFFLLMLIEAGAGLLLGIAVRLLVLALQLAGSIASQSTALAQIFGAGATPDPMPAVGNLLALAGITLAVVADLHVKATLAIAGSYDVLPIGAALPAADVLAWGAARVASAFALGFTLAAPFVIAAFAYNLALGAINKAMPQLMVSFIGAPAITAGAILLLLLASPLILTHWRGELDATLAAPLATPR
ncbi:flagellar biosynthetic protein FliR [Amaricoccus sp.]|uniref:flagellar biosynthetic protein FliR n=1 Tax=Amaricoccus sp. TaxID=1872485 RepID=UPI001B6A48FF|nr:flagellar biosynthetic protein FliR [Amaricoccus sp.]MBP7241943.1 flagellar biosynthetic protein FliR [Amaricoccus sp.]